LPGREGKDKKKLIRLSKIWRGGKQISKLAKHWW